MFTSSAPHVMTAAVAVGLAVPLLVYAFTARPDPVRRHAVRNLTRGLPSSSDHAGPEVSGTGLSQLARRLTPAGRVRAIDALLAKAGRPAAWPLERVLVTKLVAAAAAVGLGLLLVGTGPSLQMLVLLTVVAVMVWYLPDLLLYNTGMKRREHIELKLPDALDQLTIAVDAGLGFESALANVAQNSAGPLADELIRTLQDIQVGVPRRTAYLSLVDRVPVADLRRFIRSIVQAEQHGISVATVLSTQAKEMRLRRRQRAEEKAMQIPIKVIFPLVLFILPALFIVILGPAAINIIAAFSKI